MNCYRCKSIFVVVKPSGAYVCRACGHYMVKSDGRVNCGWCGLRVADLDHVVQCRKTKGRTSARLYAAELQNWINDVTGERPYQVRLNIRVNTSHEDALLAAEEVEAFLVRKYPNVRVELA